MHIIIIAYLAWILNIMSNKKTFDARFKSCAKVGLMEFKRSTEFLSQSKRAVELTQYAIDEGYVSERPAIFGSHLSWEAKGKGEKSSPHWWVVKSAFDLAILSGWRPSNEHTWKCFMYYHLKKNGPYMSGEDAINSLDDSFDKSAGIVIMDQLEDRLAISERTKPISCVVDVTNDPVSLYFSSSERAKKSFMRKGEFESFDKAVEAGYKIRTEHVLKHLVESAIEEKNNEIEALFV